MFLMTLEAVTGKKGTLPYNGPEYLGQPHNSDQNGSKVQMGDTLLQK